ncbi:hypothetical protein HY635_02810 [Candidatus Uhrbacteria bacterium]|nr:hypothetical protein [Candidatus Uhrbacteria bacterium]
MTIDREFIVAALSGMLREGIPDDEFIDTYGVSSSEARRAAIVAVQTLMQGGQEVRGPTAVARVQELTQRFSFTKDELANMAWEVLRGAVEDPESERDIAYHVVKWFLRDRLPRQMSFPYTGAIASFEPKTHPGGAGDLLGDLVYRDPTYTPHRPSEVVQLLRCAGINL